MSQTVLVADDSNTIRQIVEMALKASPFDVVGVGSAQGAMDAARQQPAVILLDYYMPDGSGYDVCRALKSDAGTSGIPVIMLGGTYKNFDENLARQSGADAILMKPFKTDQLLDAVESARSGGAPAAEAAPPQAQQQQAQQQQAQQQQRRPEPEPEPIELEVEPMTPQPHHQPAQARTPSTPPPAGSQPRIATPDVNASSRQPSSTQPPAGAASGGGSGPVAVGGGGMGRSEIEKLVKEEVKNAVRTELPGLLRNIMGEVFQQKVLPKLVQHAEERVDSLVSQQLSGQIQSQVRSELERLLSEE